MFQLNSGRRSALLIILALMLTPALTVFAQNQTHIHIHEVAEPQPVNTTGGATGLAFQSSFSLLDGENQVLTAFEIVDATYELEGESYEAVIQELETPWTIVVLVDASKTLGGFTASAAFRNLRTALSSAVNGVPDNTNIAVMTFADNVQTVFEFDQAKDRAAQAIDRIRAQAAGNSCLNDGLYQAINKMAGAPGRRAVILATASLDDCANRTQQEVLSLAETNRVQIYAVGLQGYSATQDGLDNFTGPTGGLAEIRNENNLLFGFSNIFAIFKNQWTARATIYPSAGNQTTELVINLSDESSLISEPLAFVSSQDYLPPAKIDLVGTVQSLADGIVFNLDITQPDKISQLNVNIVSKTTGQAVLAQSLSSFSDVNRLPAVNLEAGQEYTIQVSAIDFNGQLLSNSQAEFTYEPPQAGLAITQVLPPEVGEDTFQVEFSTQNLGDAVKFRGWIAQTQGETEIDGTRTTVPLGEPLELPASGLRAGEYLVIAQALSADDTVLAESKPFELNYQPPGMFRRLGNWASNSPVALAGLTALCCLTSIGLVAIFWFVVPRRGAADADVDLVMPERAKQTPSRPRDASRDKPKIKRPERPARDQEHTEPKPPPKVPAKPPSMPEKSKAEPRAKARKLRPGAIPLPAEAPTVHLKIVEPASVEYSIQMTSTPFHVGRRKDNDAVLPLDSASGVSGHHLSLKYKEGVFFVTDEESTYGTSVNGEPVARGKAKQLHNGDIINLGPKVKIQFQKVRS